MMVAKLFKDSNFFTEVIRIGLPVAALAVVQSSLGIIDQIMVGGLGEKDIAAVSLGGKPISIFYSLIYAIAAGASIFIAQYWGEDKNKSFAGIMNTAFVMSLVILAVFTGITFGLSQEIMSIFTEDESVKEIGSGFLKVLAIGYLPIVIIALYSSALRSIGNVKLPMYTGLVSVFINTFFNWVLIYGNFGFPEFGALGAAYATVIARFVEVVLLVVYVSKTKTIEHIHLVNCIKSPFLEFGKISKVVLPIVYMSITFTLADVLYSAIYGRMSTDSLVAMSIVFPVQGVIIAFFTGLSAASGILVGQKLGAGKNEGAYSYAMRFIFSGFVFTNVVAVISLPLIDMYLAAFNISSDVRTTSKVISFVVLGFLWVKVANMIMMQGVLNTGGKTMELFYINLIGQWVISIPAGLLAAFVFGLPVYWVFFIISFEEIIRAGYCFNRTLSKKWIAKVE